MKKQLRLTAVLLALVLMMGCAPSPDSPADDTSDVSVSDGSDVYEPSSSVPVPPLPVPPAPSSVPPPVSTAPPPASSAPASSVPSEASEVPPASSASSETSAASSGASAPPEPTVTRGEPLTRSHFGGEAKIHARIGLGVTLTPTAAELEEFFAGFAWDLFVPADPVKTLAANPTPSVYRFEIVGDLNGTPFSLTIYENEQQALAVAGLPGNGTYSYYDVPPNRCYGYIYDAVLRLLQKYNSKITPLADFLTGMSYYHGESNPLMGVGEDPSPSYSSRGMLRRSDFGADAALNFSPGGSRKPDPAMGLTIEQVNTLFAGFAWDKFIPAAPDKDLTTQAAMEAAHFEVRGEGEKGPVVLCVFETGRQALFIEDGKYYYYDVPRNRCYGYLEDTYRSFFGEG